MIIAKARPGAQPLSGSQASMPVVSPRHTTRAQLKIVERALLWAFVAALAWCPFWLGSNVLVTWGINSILFPGLVAIYEFALLIGGKRHPVAIWQIKAPAALFVAVLLWILIQNATWTPDWFHHPIWQMAADKLERPVDGSISVDRELTWLAFLRLLTAASVFWLALQLCRDASRADLLLSSIAAIGCAYAAYGLFAFALAPGRILWFKSPEGQVVTSTFVNRNSFAAYAGISFIVFCGLILRLYGQELKTGAGSIRFRIANFIEVTGKQGVVLLCGAFVALTALLATGSRGGISSSMFGLLVLALLALRLRKRQLEQYAIIIFCTLLVGAAFLAFGDLVAGRIALQGFGDQSRIAVYKLVMISILDVPLLGYGYGTFADVFPMFRDNSVSTFGQWQMAHNTYLELFQGLGVLFGAMFLASVVLLAWRCVEGATSRRMNVTPACVAASVAVLLGVDSLVDFSLQIQAIAITFMALLGAGVAQSESSQLVLSD